MVRHWRNSSFSGNSCDAGDGLDIGIAAIRTLDKTIRTQRAGAQYALLQRPVSESTISNVKYSGAFGEKTLAGSFDINPDTSGAGCGVSGRSEGEQQRCGNQGFHGSVLPFTPWTKLAVGKIDSITRPVQGTEE